MHHSRERDLELAWFERSGDEGLMVGAGTVVIAQVDPVAGLYAAAYATQFGGKVEYIGQPTSHAQAFANVLTFTRENLGERPIWRRDAAWRRGAPTELQRMSMKRLKLPGWNDPSLTKGTASEQLSGYIIEIAGRRLRAAWAVPDRAGRTRSGVP